MKRLARSTILALVALLLVAMPVLAGRSTLDIDTSQCEQVSITATRSSNTSNMVKIYVDGVYVAGKTGWLTVSLTYTGSVNPGNHTAMVKYYERKWVVHEYIWDLRKTITRVFRIDACHDYGAHLSVDNTCDGLDINVVITDFGNPIHTENIAFVPWIDPYVIESFGPETGQVPLPDGSEVTLTLPETFEPERCLVVLKHHYKIKVKKNCEDWVTTVVSNDGGVATPLTPTSGIWLDPYTREMFTVSYEIVWPDGYVKTVSKNVKEPKRCLVVLEGCTDPNAENYDPEAEYDDGSCIYYGVCSETIAVIGEWGPLYSLGVGEGHEKQRTVTVYDARDPSVVCGTHIEREHQCVNEFIMWLLEGTHPDASGILQCYIVSPTHPGVERYQRICFPCLYPDFVASRGVAGYVDSCDNWTLDNERLYWRKPLADLLAMNARHAAGIYYPIVCEGCE